MAWDAFKLMHRADQRGCLIFKPDLFSLSSDSRSLYVSILVCFFVVMMVCSFHPWPCLLLNNLIYIMDSLDRAAWRLFSLKTSKHKNQVSDSIVVLCRVKNHPLHRSWDVGCSPFQSRLRNERQADERRARSDDWVNTRHSPVFSGLLCHRCWLRLTSCSLHFLMMLKHENLCLRNHQRTFWMNKWHADGPEPRLSCYTLSISRPSCMFPQSTPV